MAKLMNLPQQLVFGLDIGTRSIVGTVGYLENDVFHAVAQCVKEHTSRAMIDGQIHDINKVGETIQKVKKVLEEQIDRELKEVCIAAAGRVLKTVTTTVEIVLDEEKVVDREDVYALDLVGIDKAQEQLNKENESEIRFYCVGYSVMKYYLNGEFIVNLEGHKAAKIGEELIATFLPEEVVDGLYAAVAQAGLDVANLTLEPIAAINVAIPERFRMLNIGLVDVGAGTSDICLTKDGSIIAYGMIPMAGDELTDVISRQYLVEFDMAEKMKTAVPVKLEEKKNNPENPLEMITYQDIIGISHEVSPVEICDLLSYTIEDITGKIAEKIIELNGDKPVSAVFVVGGGGRFPGFTEKLAEKLGIIPERVALRGEEVLGQVKFYQKNVKKDSLLVTPIGICLNFYDKKNNFIFVNFNGERIKLYNTQHLTVVEAAMQAVFPNDGLFPKRGSELNFTVNGKSRMIRGELGEAAVVTVNGQSAGINTPITSNDRIQIQPSTAGSPAKADIQDLPEYGQCMDVIVNGARVSCPKFVQVNGNVVSGFYGIQNHDEITILNYYTLKQLLEYMDVVLSENTVVMINNKESGLEDKIYDNFTVEWFESTGMGTGAMETIGMGAGNIETADLGANRLSTAEPDGAETLNVQSVEYEQPQNLLVIVNGKPVTMYGKSEYIFVNVFDFIDFDLSTPQKGSIVTNLNGRAASFTEILKAGDAIDIYWEDSL